MPKNIDPKLKKIGEYLKLEKQTNFVIPEINVHIRGKSSIVISYGKILKVLSDLVAVTHISLEQS